MWVNNNQGAATRRPLDPLFAIITLMISYVWTPSSFWTPAFPLIPGNGGTETFTLGHCRELNRRGIKNQIITFRLGKEDGRKLSPDLTFVDYPLPVDMGKLKGDVILATEP